MRKQTSSSADLLAGFGTLQMQVAGLHRAGPSATLDKAMKLYLYFTDFLRFVKAFFRLGRLFFSRLLLSIATGAWYESRLFEKAGSRSGFDYSRGAGRSRVRGASCTVERASTSFPAGTEAVSHTEPPMTQSSPMRVSPPRMVAPE